VSTITATSSCSASKALSENAREESVENLNERRAPEVRPVVDSGDVQPSARVKFIAPGRIHAAEGLDAVAGCEFLDDRIRLLE
jgi:hypothetical protein